MCATPRRFSQLTASFIACQCQGIRRAPVYACPEYHSRFSIYVANLIPKLSKLSKIYTRCNTGNVLRTIFSVRKGYDPAMLVHFGGVLRFHHRPGIAAGLLLRKEVIQPLVPQRLPCYDFIPITTHTLDGPLPCGLGRRLRVQTAFMM